MTPDQEFTVAFNRMNNGWAIIDSLRNVAALGMPYAKKVVDVQHKSFVSELVESGHLEKFIIGIKDADDLKKTAAFWMGSVVSSCIGICGSPCENLMSN